LLNALVTLASMQDRLASHDVTVHKLRKLLGIEKSSEKQTDVIKKTKKPTQNRRSKRHNDQGFTPVKAKVNIRPLSFLRITGHSPFTPEQHVMARYRCNTCGTYLTADLPKTILADASATQKYGYSTRALMAIYKYFAGLPFYRQSSIQKLLGVNLTASTVFDQVERVCDAIYPVYQLLLSLAADAEPYYLDDTTHRILDARPIEKKVRNNNKIQLRTGVYTSGVIATTTAAQSIVLFETNIGHAGEFIDSILHKRALAGAKSIIMSDALAR
jgi:transposase